MNTMTIPVTVAPEAAELAAEQGVQGELERVLDYLCREVQGVTSVEVQVVPPYDTGDENAILIDVLIDRPLDDLSAHWQIRDWKISTFPPRVIRYLSVSVTPVTNPGDILPYQNPSSACRAAIASLPP